VKAMSEQFTKLALSNKEKRIFPSQSESNPRGGSTIDPNDVQKVNAIIFLRLDKKVDTYAGEQNVNEFPSPSSSSSFPQSGDMTPTLIDSISSKELDDPNESESINDSFSPKDTTTPSSCASNPPSIP